MTPTTESSVDGESGRALRYMLRRVAIGVFALWFAASMVFFAIHLGARPPADSVPEDHPRMSAAEEQRALDQKKARFGLDRPLHVRYVDYLTDVATLEFGARWSSERDYAQAHPETDVDRIVFGAPLHQTLWLWAWTLLITLLVGAALALALWYSPWSPAGPGLTVTGALLRALPVVVLGDLVAPVLEESERFLFGFDWNGFLVDHYGLAGPVPLSELGTHHARLVAIKETLPLALVLATALLPSAVRVFRHALRNADRTPWRDGDRATGMGDRKRIRRATRRTGLPLVSTVTVNLSILLGGTMWLEARYATRGLGDLFVEAVTFRDFTTVQALLVLATLFLICARLLEEALYVRLAGVPESRDDRAADYWTGVGGDSGSDGADAGRTSDWGVWQVDDPGERLRSLTRDAAATLHGRVRERPRPAAVWLTGGLVLFAVEAGAVLGALELLPFVSGLPDLPTLLDRQHFPNLGYVEEPGGPWKHTAFGLSPKHAWLLRVGLVYLYALAWGAWLVLGYRLYRSTYRAAETTPLDAALGRFRNHTWGRLGLVIVAVFLVAALFAPTLAAMPLDAGESGRTITVYDDRLDIVREIRLGKARSPNSPGGGGVPVASYDRFNNFRPLGTVGTSLSSLLVGIRTFFATAALAATCGVGLALVTLATVRSRVLDALGGGAAEVVALLPTLPFAYYVTAQLQNPRPPRELYGGYVGPRGEWLPTFALAAFLAVLLWPALWRTLRRPVVRASARGWVDAARGYGATTRGRVRRHVLGRLVGQSLVYGLLTAVGVSIGLATLAPHTYMVRGNAVGSILDPTRPPITWADAGISALAGTILLFGLLCLADGIRAAADPTDLEGASAPGEAAAAGGAG